MNYSFILNSLIVSNLFLCLIALVSDLGLELDRFEVQLNGDTKFKGKFISGAPSIAYPLQDRNVFILGKPDSQFVKMVKVKVTGEKTFDWLDAKFIGIESDPKCGEQSTFHEGCFIGKSLERDKYDVDLVAKIEGLKGILIKNANKQS